MTNEERINKAIEPLDNAIRTFKKVIRKTWPKDHPDAILLTESYENLSSEKEILNINDPSK